MVINSLSSSRTVSISVILIVGTWILLGCIGTQDRGTSTPKGTLIPSSSIAATSLPTNTSTTIIVRTATSTTTTVPTVTPTPEPTNTPLPYCTELAEEYTPPEGYQLFCDSKFEHALVFPLDWETKVEESSPYNLKNPLQILKGQDFYNYDVSNDIRLETWQNAQALPDLAERQMNIMGCKDQCFTSPIRLGGKTGYVLIVPSLPQSYDVLFTFFKQGDYYFSQLVLMINTKAGLDVYWQMIQSLQFLRTTPADNEIPVEVINESYRHVGNYP